MRLIAKTFKGLESVLAQELVAIGAENVTELTESVEFEGDKRVLYRANLELRTAIRILYPIVSFRARNEEHLQEGVYSVDWSRYVGANETLAIDVVVNSDYFKGPGLVAMKAKDAISEQFNREFGERPSIDTIMPVLRINIVINDDSCEISLDSSGDPLFKRGIERQTLDSSINEVMAAGMILLSGWKGECDFIDPMCGSATFLLEAAMIAYNIPPMMHRSYFTLKKWANFDKALWDEILEKAKSNIKSSANCKILGYDSAFQALRVSDRNIQDAGLEDKIVVKRLAIEKQESYKKPAILITYPPYVEHLTEDEIKAFYKSFGDALKRKFTDSTAWLVAPNVEILKHLGIRSVSQFELNNGRADLNLVKYELKNEVK